MIKYKLDVLVLYLILVFIFLAPFISLLLLYILTILMSLLLYMYNIKVNKCFYLVVGIYVSFLSTLFALGIDNVLDVKEYHDMFKTISADSYNVLDYGGEYLFVVLTKFFYIINNNVSFIYFCFVFISLLSLFYILYRFDFKWSLVVFILSLFTGALFSSTFLIRQNLAMMFLFLFAINSNGKALFSIASFFIHSSVLIQYLGFYLYKKIKSKILINTMLIVTIVFYFIFNIHYILKFNDFIFQSFNIKTKLYFYDSLNISSISYHLDANFIIAVVMLLISRYLIFNTIDKREFIVFTIFISSCLYIASYNIPILPNRVGFLVYFYPTACFFILLKSFNGDKLPLRYILLYVVGFLLVVTKAVMLLYKNDYGLNEVLYNRGFGFTYFNVRHYF